MRLKVPAVAAIDPRLARVGCAAATRSTSSVRGNRGQHAGGGHSYREQEALPAARFSSSGGHMLSQLEIAYYFAYAPLGTDVEHLVPIAGTRWAIEEAFQAAKNDWGLDQYEVCRYTAGCGTSRRLCRRPPARRSWPPTPPQRGMQIRFLPGASHRGRGSAAPGNWPPTNPPTRNSHQPLINARALRWSHRRRRRQAVARHCHYQRRRRTFEGRSGEDCSDGPSARHIRPNRP